MKKNISKKQLQKYLDELVALAKTVTSDVESEVHIPGDDGQHAWLKLYVPDELEERIDDLILERANDIFIETGYDIAAIAYEKSRLQHSATEAEAGYDGRQEAAREDDEPVKAQKTISQKQLQKYLDELVAIAQNLTSDVETAVQIPGVEGQHAWLEIYVPGELEEQISDLVSERVLDIFMETGCDIGAIVYEKSYLQQTLAATAELLPQN